MQKQYPITLFFSATMQVQPIALLVFTIDHNFQKSSPSLAFYVQIGESHHSTETRLKFPPILYAVLCSKQCQHVVEGPSTVSRSTGTVYTLNWLNIQHSSQSRPGAD